MKLRKRILGVSLAILCGMMSFSGCKEEEKEKVEEKKAEKVVKSEYVINDKSDIADDFEVFGLDLADEIHQLEKMDISAIFPGDINEYIYLKMPSDTADYAYRAQKVTINGSEYKMTLVDMEKNAHKYIIEDLGRIDSGEYEITEFEFLNEKTKKTTQYNLEQLITVKLDESGYSFEQEYRYSIILSGQLFESVYQFNKENNAFIDLWAHLIRSTKKLDMDQRSFYYFAFNCYDRENDRKFTPDDIMRLDVKYDLITYEYDGKDKKKAEDPEKEIKRDILQEIEPDEIKVMAKDEKRSNKRLYKYNTINKLSEADLTRNIEDTNSAVLKQAARKYDWAVAFGSEDGYTYKKNKAGLILPKYDIEYTEIEDFKTIFIKYRYEGKIFDARTSSLVTDDVIQVVEDYQKPTKVEVEEYNWNKIWDSDNNWSWKARESVKFIIKQNIWIVIGITIFIIIIIALKMRQKRWGQLIKKQINKIIDKQQGDTYDE